MLCPYCGAGNVDYALYCFKCGANIKPVSTDSKEKKDPSTEENEATFIKDHEPSPVGNTNLLDKYFFIATLLMASLFVIVGYYYTQIMTIEDTMLRNIFYVFTRIAAAYTVLILCIFLYRAWSMLQGHGARTTPGRAVGFLFIPLFNIYWVFQAVWGFAKDYNNILQNLRSDAPKLPESLFLFTSFLILFFPLLLVVNPEILIALVVISFFIFAYLFTKISSTTNVLLTAGKNNLLKADAIKTKLSLNSFTGDAVRLGGTLFALLLSITLLFAVFTPRSQYEVKRVICPEQIVHGEDLVVAVDTANTGSAEGVINLTLFVDDKEVKTKDVFLSAQAVEEVTFDLTDRYSPGSYHFSLGLGADQEIDDEFSGEFRVLKPAEFTLSSFSLSPKQIDITEEAAVSVNITNIGEADGEYKLPLLVNGVMLKEADISLASGESTTVEYDIKMDDPGLFSLELNGISETLKVIKIEQPDNGTVFTNKVRGGNGHFRVENNRAKDVLVILSNPENPQDTLLAVYVHSKNSASISGIRDGVYEIYFSHGEDWDSYANKFTRNVEHYRFDETQRVVTTSTAYTSFWIELGVIGVETEAHSEGVDAEEFPTF